MTEYTKNRLTRIRLKEIKEARFWVVRLRQWSAEAFNWQVEIPIFTGGLSGKK